MSFSRNDDGDQHTRLNVRETRQGDVYGFRWVMIEKQHQTLTRTKSGDDEKLDRYAVFDIKRNDIYIYLVDFSLTYPPTFKLSNVVLSTRALFLLTVAVLISQYRRLWSRLLTWSNKDPLSNKTLQKENPLYLVYRPEIGCIENNTHKHEQKRGWERWRKSQFVGTDSWRRR